MKKLEISNLETINGGGCVASTTLLVVAGAGLLAFTFFTGGLAAPLFYGVYFGSTVANTYSCA